MNELKRPLIGNRVIASYKSENLEEMFRNNAFIEALPPLYSPEKVISLMQRRPYYNEEQRSRSNVRRIQAVTALDHYIQPLTNHIKLEQGISGMIRNGYLTRNPIEAEWIKQMRQGFPELDWDAGYEGYTPMIKSPNVGSAIIGISGVGKTTMVESVLGLYPQVIEHTEYHGHHFNQCQLVWLKLDTPFDGSTKGLCLGFFETIDAILGTKYYYKFKNAKKRAEELLYDMAMLAARLGIGILVIDEIQRLNVAHSGGEVKMLNFFVQLSNVIGIPVLLVGTPNARPLFISNMASGRRNCSQGNNVEPKNLEGEEWDIFIEGFWEYQWTNINTPLTEELKNAMYEETLGIPDFVIKLYKLIQWEAIGRENEEITPSLIHMVAQEYLPFAQPLIEALKKGDKEQLQKFNDIYPDSFNLDDYRRIAEKRVLEIQMQKKEEVREEKVKEKENRVARIESWLIDYGLETDKAREIVKEALIKYGRDADTTLIMQYAFQLANNSTSTPKPEKGPNPEKKVTSNLPYDSLIKITQKNKDVSRIELLRQAGIIKNPEEFN